jgi:hypothetical protein
MKQGHGNKIYKFNLFCLQELNIRIIKFNTKQERENYKKDLIFIPRGALTNFEFEDNFFGKSNMFHYCFEHRDELL